MVTGDVEASEGTIRDRLPREAVEGRAMIEHPAED
jgi:hypothetical protein